MKRRLFDTEPEKQPDVQKLRPESPYIHYRCHRRSCGHPAIYTVYSFGKKVENLCRHHASNLCERHGLHLPDAS